MAFMIAEARTVKRASIEKGGVPLREYVVDPRLGRYSSRVVAKASFMRAMDPALANADDEFAAGHFDRMQRNTGGFKVVRVEG